MKSILFQIRPAFVSAFLINLFYGKSFQRRKVTFIKKYKISMFTDSFSHLGHILEKEKTYEDKTSEFILNNLNEDSVFFDIGANEGYFSVLASKKNIKGKTYSFEPVQSLIPIINKNISINKIKNCRVLNIGIGKNNYKTKINLFPEINSGASSIIRKYRFFSKSQIIQIKSLDNFYREENLNFVIDLIKIDVEGYEMQVIEGMKNLLKNKKIKNLLFYYHLQIISKNDQIKIDKDIISNGYKKTEIEPNYFLYKLNK